MRNLGLREINITQTKVTRLEACKLGFTVPQNIILLWATRRACGLWFSPPTCLCPSASVSLSPVDSRALQGRNWFLLILILCIQLSAKPGINRSSMNKLPLMWDFIKSCYFPFLILVLDIFSMAGQPHLWPSPSRVKVVWEMLGQEWAEKWATPSSSL